MSGLSLQIPLVAYRGLWDKFAGPGTTGAFRRAYLRGVACVLSAESLLPHASEVSALADDPAVNRRARALYLAADPRGASGARALARWTGTVWNPCGLYISARAAAAGLDVADFIALDSSASPIVLVESFNVLEYGDEMAVAHGLSDDDVLEDVQAMAGSTVRIARVSDYVELDQLERQRVEAA